MKHLYIIGNGFDIHTGLALECPRRLYYAYDKDVYANQDIDDEFLKSLAEGGFQVGEFAIRTSSRSDVIEV